MRSTGNDIVSVNAINVTRTKQPNFYSKILTPTETVLHLEPRFATIPFEIFVWLLWSVKESAFKFLQRINANVLFTPVKFEVSDIYVSEGFELLAFDKTEWIDIGFEGFDPIQATIRFNDKVFYSTSLIYREFIISVVNDINEFDKIHWGVKQIEGDEAEIQSAEVRAFLIDKSPDKNIMILKNDNGIPAMLLSNGMNVPVSFSHHDKWVGYSFQL